MSGPIALHGGGEFLPGDEAVLGALLELAAGAARSTPIRIAVVPAAAAGGRPELAAANGVAAFERVARAANVEVSAASVPVIDPVSAADPTLSQRLEEADIIHLPGGDPALVPGILAGSAAWRAIASAHGRGAVIAGASAGAMGLASITWSQNGVLAGLGLVDGLVVVPHADAARWNEVIEQYGRMVPPGIGLLGLAERTAVIIVPGEPWRVIGEGEVRWLAPGASEPIVAGHGERIEPASR